MRWVVGPIPPSKVLDAEQQGWRPLSEPNVLVFTLQAAFLSIPFCVMAYLAACQLKPYVKCHPYLPVALLVSMLCLVFVHELLHVLGYPLRSRHLVIVFWPQSLFPPFPIYDAPLPRNRILFMLSFPFIILAVILIIVMALSHSPWRDLGLFLLFLHVIICTGDFFTFTRIFRQVPPKAFVHNAGWKTYWTSDYTQTVS